MSGGLILDLLILLPLAWGAYQGYTRGLLAEMVAIIHFAIAFAISFRVVGFIFRLVHENIYKFRPELFPELAFACMVGLSLVLLTTAGKYLKTEIEYDFPGAWDNIIGAVFGIMKYAIVLSFFFWFMTGFGTLETPVKNNSKVYGIVEAISYQLLNVDNHDRLSEKIEQAL